MVIVAPYEHKHVDASSRAGSPSTVTPDDPGVHALRRGWHGCGVSTP
jgi:hypothetical protein